MTYENLKKIGTKIDVKDYYNNGIYSFTREFWVCQSGLYVHEQHPNTNHYSGQTTTYQVECLEDIGKISPMYAQAYIGLSEEGLERARAYAEKTMIRGGAEMERLHGVERCMGIDCEVWAFIPDDATYVVVVNGERQYFDLSKENWEDDEDLAKLIYDRLD